MAATVRPRDASPAQTEAFSNELSKTTSIIRAAQSGLHSGTFHHPQHTPDVHYQAEMLVTLMTCARNSPVDNALDRGGGTMDGGPLDGCLA
jgi:hypothetical protein